MAPENELWLDASTDLLSLFAESGGQRALFAGTSAEYDWRLDLGRSWREDDPCVPQTLYGQSKHELHQRATVIASQTRLSLVWARLFTIFGPHEDPRRVVPTICRALVDGTRSGPHLGPTGTRFSRYSGNRRSSGDIAGGEQSTDLSTSPLATPDRSLISRMS